MKSLKYLGLSVAIALGLGFSGCGGGGSGGDGGECSEYTKYDAITIYQHIHEQECNVAVTVLNNSFSSELIEHSLSNKVCSDYGRKEEQTQTGGCITTDFGSGTNASCVVGMYL